MSIMIIGSQGEYHAHYIYEKLREKGQACFYLDTRLFPSEVKLNLSPADSSSSETLITPEGQTIRLADIKSVYWRYHHGVEVSPEVPQDISGIVYREIESALGSLFRNMPHATWVNPVSAIERHRYKTHQLFLMAQHGIRVPDTLISNDPDMIKQFYEKHQYQVIYKPVAGGAHTAKLKEEDLKPERMQELRLSPVQFQEYIPGVDIRVYLIGENLYAAEIQAGTLDFRDNPDAPIVKVDLPEPVQNQCRLLAQLFEYRFTGIDVRRTPDGEYVFLEGNPSPMFAHFENKTGYPISDELIALLTA